MFNRTTHVHYYPTRRKRYGLGTLLFDALMTFLTGGLWLIWLLIRFLRNS